MQSIRNGRIVRLMACAVALLIGAAQAWAQEKHALVIGNGAYRNIETLENPVNDSTDIKVKLERLGYQVELKTNATQAAMGRAISDFMRRLSTNPANEGFFWYAGHGVEINGENYLLPVDVGNDEDSARYMSIRVNELLDQFQHSARNAVNVVVLDACRNNPFAATPNGTRGAARSRGLQVVEVPPQNLFVIFSTAPRTTASDGGGARNSPFAQAFIKHIEKPEPLVLLLTDITNETLRLTKNQQRPFTQGSFSTRYTIAGSGSQPSPQTLTAKQWFEKGLAENDYDKKIAAYTEAIRLDPKYANAYDNRGAAYHMKKDYDRAIADYTEAIRLDPKYANAYDNRGAAYHMKKDYDRAIADYTEAIRLDPKYAHAYYSRGIAYYVKKDYSRAIADYEQCLRLDPNNANAKKFLELARQARGY